MTSVKGRHLSSSYNHAHKIFNFGHIIRRKFLKFLYNNCMLLFYLILLNFAKIIHQKRQRLEQNKNKKNNLTFLERDVNASYLSVLTRFQHRMKVQP